MKSVVNFTQQVVCTFNEDMGSLVPKDENLPSFCLLYP